MRIKVKECHKRILKILTQQQKHYNVLTHICKPILFLILNTMKESPFEKENMKYPETEEDFEEKVQLIENEIKTCEKIDNPQARITQISVTIEEIEDFIRQLKERRIEENDKNEDEKDELILDFINDTLEDMSSFLSGLSASKKEIKKERVQSIEKQKTKTQRKKKPFGELMDKQVSAKFEENKKIYGKEIAENLRELYYLFQQGRINGGTYIDQKKALKGE